MAWKRDIDSGSADEGQNLVVASRLAEAKLERLPQLALELVNFGPDIVVAVGATEVRAIKQATTTIPIVMVVVADPVGLGFVRSLARPGGNITGMTSTPGPRFHGKRLELLRELAPDAARIALLVNPGNPDTAVRVQATDAAARVLGVHVRVIEVRTTSGLNGAFAKMKQERIQAALVASDRAFSAVWVRLAELAALARMPVVYDIREYVEAGGLAAYGPSHADQFRRAAGYVDRILKGRKPADLAVEQPTQFELILNRKTANTLGLASSFVAGAGRSRHRMNAREAHCGVKNEPRASNFAVERTRFARRSPRRSSNHHAIKGGDHATVRITGTQQTIEEAPT